ncbi:unnamed protein product, partial [marine sediment metagenome]
NAIEAKPVNIGVMGMTNANMGMVNANVRSLLLKALIIP